MRVERRGDGAVDGEEADEDGEASAEDWREVVAFGDNDLAAGAGAEGREEAVECNAEDELCCAMGEGTNDEADEETAEDDDAGDTRWRFLLLGADLGTGLGTDLRGLADDARFERFCLSLRDESAADISSDNAR